MKLQRWTFLRELIPLALLLLVLDCFLFERKLFTQEPSPLWLLILFIPPRRGSVAGFTCGLAASVIYLWNLSEQGHLWQDLLHRQPTALINPSLFLLFGVYLGAIGESQIRNIVYFKDKATSLAEQLDSSEVKRAMLERNYLEMEKHIAGEDSTLLTLQNKLQKLTESTSERELLLVLVSLLCEESKTTNCGIWRVFGEHPKLVAGRFNGAIPPIALAVGQNHKMINAADWLSYNEAPPGADLSALVFNNESERIVVAVEGIPFVLLTRNFTQKIGLLVMLAGVMLRTVRSYEILRKNTILDAEFGLVSEGYLRHRIIEEIGLVKRDKMQLSLLACSITSNHNTTQSRFEDMFSGLLRACTRLTDGIARFPEHRAFVILLPECDEPGAVSVLKRIESGLEMLDLRNAHNQTPYDFKWNVLEYNKDMNGDTIFERLFSGMHGKVCA